MYTQSLVLININYTNEQPHIYMSNHIYLKPKSFDSVPQKCNMVMNIKRKEI